MLSPHFNRMPELTLQSPLQYVKGVGPKKAEILSSYGYRTVGDILHYFPRHYLDRTNVSPIGTVRPNEPITVVGKVVSHGMLYGRKKRYEVILQDETGAVSLVFFQGLRYWSKNFKKNQVFAASGTVTFFAGMQMVHPDLERLEDETDLMIHAGRIIPVYPQTAELSQVGLNSKGMRTITNFIFTHLEETMYDYLPENIRVRHNLESLDRAIRILHYPESRELIELGRKRLAFDELLSFQFMVFKSKQNKDTITKQHAYKKVDKVLQSFITQLPFTLTEGQIKVFNEIQTDMLNSRPMTRLLQGDVGCGKTIVAVLAGLLVAQNKMQTAFMAPTEILAEQHFRNWEQPLKDAGISSGLLTSSLKAPRKKEIAERCAAGAIQMLFGTHALSYDDVTFDRFGLVIIDEQHRFGVEQRGRLYAKGDNPDLLVMTATPIPRTLALTLYGDLDISTIDTLPTGRQPIKTVWRTSDVRDKVYKYILDDVAKGGQTYIVYPLIEKSEMMELENVEDAYKALSSTVFKNIRLAMIHGRVKAKERDEHLRAFFAGEIDVLMATTVIEVGLDNPNATIMVIEHAERFGLAQLHQLRGRIGRGKKSATLVALAHPPISEIGQKRLEYFVSTTDGFKIAEADLELRGPGELYGLRQSGLPQFQSARLSQDRDILEATRALLYTVFDTKRTISDDERQLYTHLEKVSDKMYAGYHGG